MWVSNFVVTLRLHKNGACSWYLCTRSLKRCLNATTNESPKLTLFISSLTFFTQKVPQIDRLIKTKAHRQPAFGFPFSWQRIHPLLSKGVCTIPTGRLMCRESLASHSSSYQVPWTNKKPTKKPKTCSVPSHQDLKSSTIKTCVRIKKVCTILLIRVQTHCVWLHPMELE